MQKNALHRTVNVMRLFIVGLILSLTVLSPARAGGERLVLETSDQSLDLTVEIADTSEARSKGLMMRETLAPLHGMLFDFERSTVVA
ncbi:DUF192 domain-containing protein, partial [Sneathiella sp.]|uniref:DUF192 domain-containing protein n=1 Tax=Sneathiella sp. TaxID=1964365 RepID=UPI0035656222